MQKNLYLQLFFKTIQDRYQKSCSYPLLKYFLVFFIFPPPTLFYISGKVNVNSEYPVKYTVYQ